jgi:uncharacterized membrane protein YphA (DoxX/SURF4 family)
MEKHAKYDANYTIRWIVTIFIGLTFAAAGAAKVLGDPVFTGYFEDFGIPLGYMRVLGVIEIFGAVALSIPQTARYATVGLLTIGVSASIAHMTLGQPVDAVLPTALATAAAIAIWGTPGHPVQPSEPHALTEFQEEDDPSAGTVAHGR